MNELLKHDRLLQPKNRTADQIEIIGFQNFRTYLNVIMKYNGKYFCSSSLKE